MDSTSNSEIKRSPLIIPEINELECTQELGLSIVSSSTAIAEGCYVASDDIIVADGGVLNFSPGVVVRFKAGTELLVRQGGVLSAIGTVQKPVVFTAVDKTPGYWDGIEYFNSNSAANRLSHVVLEYAGGGRDGAALKLVSNTSSNSIVAVDSSLIRLNANVGVFAQHATVEFIVFQNNVVTQNVVPMSIRLDLVASLGRTNEFRGNDIDVLKTGIHYSEVDIQLQDLNIPLLSDGIFVREPNRLSILAGVEVQFSGNSDFVVQGNLSIEGTMQQPVILKGEHETPGTWRGLSIVNTALSKIHNVEIWHGGAKRFSSIAGANISVERGSLSLLNVQIAGSAGFGLDVIGQEVEIVKFEAVRFISNRVAAGLDITHVSSLVSPVDSTDNIENGIEIRNHSYINSNVVITDVGVVYKVLDTIVVGSGVLQIQSGVNIEFSANSGIEVVGQSVFAAKGDASKKIVLRGSGDVQGYWKGIYFSSSNSSRNSLEHVVLKNSGSIMGAIELECSSQSPSSLYIANTIIMSSASWGIHLSPMGCNLELGENVSFVNNRFGEMNIE